ncbi:SurA N-terminal domain-containing protein [Desulfonatronovibrio magnus]|uniref:SurA N-terminal domain-containing protein n=1 Tax=Desulfonatronovibrio magnus TaxID=698827 RepID=UPI0005EB1E84|nr:SurA N-terminal domain-containing protein [Desulfonatronovibrio magnus]RQD65576.1 MAG: hypothetical protein D5R98_02795 [Desulfonatronovibrio sp. MSAO_Bac4]
MKKILLCTLLIIFSQQFVSASLVNRVVALVDGKSITLFELDARMRHLIGLFDDVDISQIPESQLRQTQQQVLQQMINDLLLKQEAEKFGIEVTQREISNHIEQIKIENNFTKEQFEQTLRQQGLTREVFEDQIKDSIIRQRVLSMMVRRKIVVTQDEIKAYYQNNIDQFAQEKQVHLKVILVPTKGHAQRVREEIMAGRMDFNSAAQEFSQGPNADEGGDLGFVAWNRLASDWRNALTGMTQGDISQAFEVRGAGALLKLVEGKSGGSIPMEEVKDDIREIIFDTKLDTRYDEYIQGLRSNAVIDIRL